MGIKGASEEMTPLQEAIVAVSSGATRDRHALHSWTVHIMNPDLAGGKDRRGAIKPRDYVYAKGLFFADEAARGLGASHVVIRAPALSWPAYFSALTVSTPIPRAGDVMDFLLSANPTAKHGRGHREAILDLDEMREWLLRKAREHGFIIVKAHRPRAEWDIARRPNGATFRMLDVRFNGRLRVTDAVRFHQCLQGGIGRGKGFGFGMLRVRPATQGE